MECLRRTRPLSFKRSYKIDNPPILSDGSNERSFECKGAKGIASDPHDFIGELPANLFRLFERLLSLFSGENPY